jgi:hypothetical protein
MTILVPQVTAGSVSEAWVRTLEEVGSQADHHAFHVTVRIAEPGEEIAEVRAIADALLDDLGLPPISTVANTVFPSGLARRYPEPAELAARYRDYQYPRLRKLARANSGGTYFGRIVEYPTAAGSIDQLVAVVEKLRRSRTGPRRKATYEVGMGEPGMEVGIYRHGRDERKIMGFPCLSFCSFQLDDDRVHLIANYRSQYLVERAYGNYLGLGRLLVYVARAAEFDAGELLVVAGHATIEGALKPTRAAVGKARAVLDRMAHGSGESR